MTGSAQPRYLRLACLLLLSLPARPALAQSPPVAVAPSVYVLAGDTGDTTPQNLGRTGNIGFIVGTRSVLVIDTGVSFKAGEAMLAAIAGITAKPVALAVLTHPVQEFIFGAAAFQQRGVPVLAHPAGAELMRQRCELCLHRLETLLGREAMQGSLVVTPDRLIERSTAVDPGGRKVELLSVGSASTPGDLAVFDRASGTLFAGGLVSSQRIPSLRDGRLEDWIKALETLRKLPIRRIVPGFGPVGGKVEIEQMLAYLRQLDAAVSQRYRSGESLIETMRQVDLPAFRDWQGYDSTQPQNVLYVYRRLEDSEFR